MKESKKSYLNPRVGGKYVLRTEGAVLAVSVVTESTTVGTEGQEVVEHDFSDGEFTADW